MPLKRDSSGRRWVEMHLVLPGTAEQVWHAMATGPGITAWFTPTTSEDRVGGTMSFDFGSAGQGTAQITEWQPPTRFGYVEREWSEGAPDLLTEVAISPRPDGTCDAVMTHSLVARTDEWDASLEEFEQGWQGFFEILRLYLAHFASQPAVCYGASSTVKQPRLAVWERLTAELGLAGANVDDALLTSAAPVPLAATVEKVFQRSTERYMILRHETGLVNVGVYAAAGNTADDTTASLSFYSYGSAEKGFEQERRAWQSWLEELLSQ